MKNLVKFILTALIAYFLGIYMPFWVIGILVAILNVFIRTKALGSFISGFFGMGIAWLLNAWLLSTGASETINSQISEILQLPASAMPWIIALIGGITGGLAALVGQTFRNLFQRKPSDNPYH